MTDMKDFKIDNKGSGRIFSNKLLERLTRTNFLVPVLMYYTVSCIAVTVVLLNRLIYPWHILWLFPLGMLFFTLIEYLIHRFIFHFDARSEKELQLQYNIHGVHHEFPRDKDRLVMPPILSVFVAIAFYFLFTFLLGDSGLVLFAGFTAGYSTYLLIHYFIHSRKPPRNFLKILWTHHSLHHYHSVDTAFSVSFPFWDYLFGTMPENVRKKRSKVSE
jgi:sterol desaturase/sphingolipid hydroxylase (fatty acid hydroxylase superfamily)